MHRDPRETVPSGASLNTTLWRMHADDVDPTEVGRQWLDRMGFTNDRPLAVRVSASDWLEHGGTTLDETVQLARQLAERGCGLIDVSSGGNTPASEIEYGRMYQVPFAERIKREVDIAVMAVGAIQGADHANTVLATGRADLCALARPHLVDPHLTLRAAVAYDYHDQWWPPQYLPARPRPT